MSCNQNCNQGRNCNCAGWHVVPLNDLREHETNGSCWCKPMLDDEGSEPIWIHNAKVSGAGTASAGLPGYTAGDNTE